MSCPVQNRDQAHLLLDYCARRMDPVSQARFEQHLQTCTECQAELRAQQELWDALDMLHPQAATVSTQFDERLYARIAAEEEGNWLARQWRRWFASGEPVEWKPAFAMAGACIALFTVLVFGYRGQAPEPGVTAQNDSVREVKMETFEVEQAETALEDLEMLRVLNSGAGAESKPNSL